MIPLPKKKKKPFLKWGSSFFRKFEVMSFPQLIIPWKQVLLIFIRLVVGLIDTRIQFKSK